MVASGLVVGFATGGFPAYSKEISQVALVLGMTFAMTEISIAGITIFLAIGLGPIVIVVPLTTAYPIVAILVRRFWMDERLTFPQKFAIALAMVGAFLETL